MHLLKKIFTIVSQEGLLSLFRKILIRQKIKMFEKYIAQYRWSDAASVGEKLINIFPDNLSFYQRLARCYKKLGNDVLATKTLYKGLELLIDPNKVIDKLEAALGADSPIKSEYLHMGGEQNLGCVEHTRNINGKIESFFSKISSTASLERERLFYLEIYQSFEKIREITPKLINFIELDEEKFTLITMEKVQGSEPLVDENFLKQVIQYHKLISSIKYSEIKDRIPKPSFDGRFILNLSFDP